MSTGPPKSPFSSYGPTNVTKGTARSSPIRVPMSKSLMEAPFLCYKPTNITNGTTLSNSIRVPYVNGPAGGSVFKLRAHNRHHRDRPVQPHQGSRCHRARQRLRFRVTGPRTSPPGPPGPAPTGSPCQRARQRLRFRVTGPRTSPSGPPGLASSGYKA